MIVTPHASPAGSPPSSPDGTPPTAFGFSEQILDATFTNPISLDFLPDGSGRIIVVEKDSGDIKAWNGTAVATLHTITPLNNGGEQGLLGVAVDPDWPARPYLYVYFTTFGAPSYAQVARLNLTDPGGALQIDPLSLLVLIDDMPNVNTNHNGGALRFGPDKRLYVSVGDDAQAGGCLAQDRTVLAGKILRLNVNASMDPSNRSTLAPPDNPFYSNASANAKLVWAYGLRNPFRMDVDPLTGIVYIGDVGQTTWEEVSLGNVSGENFGWPYFEGEGVLRGTPCPTDVTIPMTTRFPIYFYDHGPGGASVMGTPVYRGVNYPNDFSFPPAYEGNYFLTEFYQDFLRVLRWNATSSLYDLVPGVTATDWGQGYSFHPDMIRGPYDGALYFVDFAGELGRIIYQAANQPPVAAFTVTPPTMQNPGVAFSFDASASTDDFLITAYDWDFGDATLGTGITPTHSYAAAGTYTVTLTVTDNGTLTDSTNRTVLVNAGPTAAFSALPMAVNPGVAVAFDASNSNDPELNLTTYDWNFGDGNISTGVTTSHAYANPGSYPVTLTVTDNGSLADTATAGIWVNSPPTASFTANPQPANPNVTVSFDGSASTDDGALTYSWDFGDGNTSTGVTANHAYALPGTYFASLTVTDNMTLANTTTRTINIVAGANLLPIANLTVDPATARVNTSVTFNGSDSSDPDGNITDFGFDFGDGNTTSGNASVVNHTYTVPGTYNVTLTVTDNGGNTSTVTRVVVVTALNAPPVADPRVWPSANGDILTSFHFDGLNSTDDTPPLAAYFWDFGDGTTSTSPTPAKVFATKGSHNVTLTVTDADGANDTEAMTVLVLNLPPVAAATVTPTQGDLETLFAFTAASSSDPDGNITTYEWTFGDGSNASGVTPTHSFARGTYTVVLTVMDDNGASDTATLVVTVANRAPAIIPSPVGPAVSVTSGEVQTLQVNATDPDLDNLTYAWRVNGVLVGNLSRFDFSTESPGAYEVTVTVSDGASTTPFTWTVTVRRTSGPVGIDGNGLILLLLIVLLLLGLLFALGRRRKPKEEITPAHATVQPDAPPAASEPPSTPSPPEPGH